MEIDALNLTSPPPPDIKNYASGRRKQHKIKYQNIKILFKTKDKIE
jgi:hypothetical protein